MNRAFIGSAEAPGPIVRTIGNALALGRDSGMFDHDLDPASLIAFGRRQPVGPGAAAPPRS